jgi:hypothetical protein
MDDQKLWPIGTAPLTDEDIMGMLRTVRREALEEAAKLCDAEEDNIGSPATYCGRLIRALKEQ